MYWDNMEFRQLRKRIGELESDPFRAHKTIEDTKRILEKSKEFNGIYEVDRSLPEYIIKELAKEYNGSILYGKSGCCNYPKYIIFSNADKKEIRILN